MYTHIHTQTMKQKSYTYINSYYLKENGKINEFLIKNTLYK